MKPVTVDSPTNRTQPCPDPKICPHCQSNQTYVAHRCFYVVCGVCHMTGPTSESEEEAVALWNKLPRREPGE